MHRSVWVLRVAVALSGALALGITAGARAATAETPGPTFWSFWSDGKAELDGYDLVQPRYGQPRHARAVLIFVTEPFSRSKHVKVDNYDPKNPDHFVALKLNLVRKFQTGIYDYSLMTSLFTDPANAFAPVKLTFSAQEWCGHVYQELLFDGGQISNRLFSYFEGEDVEERVSVPEGALSEDDLFVTLRGLGAEALEATGGKLKLLGSVTQRRLRHQALAFFDSELSWSAPKKLEVPAGAFEVREAAWTRQDGTRCAVEVETAYPHRIVAWSCGDGEEAKLLGSKRIPYWQTHNEGDEKLLGELGLRPMQIAP
jgi:hypothetical protein